VAEQPIVPEHRVLTAEQLEQMNGEAKQEFLDNIKEQRGDLQIHSVFHKIEEELASKPPQNGVYKISLFTRDLVVGGMTQLDVVIKVVKTYTAAGFKVDVRKWSQHTNEITNEGDHVDFVFSIPGK